MDDEQQHGSKGIDEFKGADSVSKQGEREGEAPSGFASGGGDASPYKIEELELKSIVESLLFVNTEPLTLDQLTRVLASPGQGLGQASGSAKAMLQTLPEHGGRAGHLPAGRQIGGATVPHGPPQIIDQQKVLVILERLRAEYREMGRGLQLVEVAGGYQLTTRSENAPWIKQLHAVRMATRLSRPALETLAIVTYRQPVTTPEIEAIRGVDCSGVLKTLLERRLIKIVGRKEAVGKPMLYGTTQEFLQHFGLRDLSELPPLKALDEVAKESPELTEMVQESLQGDPPTDEPAPSVESV